MMSFTYDPIFGLQYEYKRDPIQMDLSIPDDAIMLTPQEYWDIMNERGMEFTNPTVCFTEPIIITSPSCGGMEKREKGNE